MATPGATEIAGLKNNAATGFHLVRLVYLDFDGDPLYATDCPFGSLTFSATGDADLDNTFLAIEPDLQSISPITHTSENTNTVTFTLTGLITFDAALMTVIGDRTNWVGREAVIWYVLFDADAGQVGVPWRHYTGRMVNAEYGGDEGVGSVTVSAENYLASLSEASNRSYMDQEDFDAGDLSAAATLAAVNRRNPLDKAQGGGGNGGVPAWKPVNDPLNDSPWPGTYDLYD